MKITNISTAVLESNFDWTLIKIETDEKITGYGESFLGPGVTASIREFAYNSGRGGSNFIRQDSEANEGQLHLCVAGGSCIT